MTRIVIRLSFVVIFLLGLFVSGFLLALGIIPFSNIILESFTTAFLYQIYISFHFYIIS